MLQSVRGTKDLIGEDAARYRYVVDTAYSIAQRYAFQEVQTPIFEFSRVFQRTLGESSDVVSKEMYTFEDRSGETITLRPEGTAPVMRAVISNGLTQSLPLKLFYSGPMFRYERPQKGRQRQFHQVGVELIGPKTPMSDAETIILGSEFLQALGLGDSVELQINTLGDESSREAYKAALVDYLAGYKSDLSAESQDRLVKNPLRILDSKNEKDRSILEAAPSFSDFLNDASKSYFEGVLSYLDEMNIAYTVNQRLVRGLDYYTHTAFEFVTNTLGAQGAVLAGGRYDQLMQQMGGPETSGVGWAAGVERLCLMLLENDETVKSGDLITVVPVTPAYERVAFSIVQKLRKSGILSEMEYSGNVSKRMKKAVQRNSKFVVICGEEIDSGNVVVKHLLSGQQEIVALDKLVKHFAQHNQ